MVTALQVKPSPSFHGIAMAALSARETARQPEPLGEMVAVTAGSQLYRQEDDATFLYKVIEGSVRAFTFTSEGRRQVNGFHFPGDAFGSGQSGCYRSSAEAVTDCILVRYRCQQLSGSAQFLLDVALAEINAAEEQILLLGRTSACAKVAAFLLHLAGRDGREALAGMTVSIPMTRYDIADFLGLSAESVSRCFTKLKQKGLIEMDTPDAVTLVDPDALCDLPRWF